MKAVARTEAEPEIVAQFRTLIAKACPDAVEETKWNAPSFRLIEHFATFNFAPKKPVRLIFHRGARTKSLRERVAIEDPEQLLTWLGTDRAVVTFDGPLTAKQRTALTKIIRAWVKTL